MKFTDSCRFVSNALSNITDNLSEKLYEKGSVDCKENFLVY